VWKDADAHIPSCDKPRPNTKRSNQYVIQGTVSNSREIARMILLECPIS